MSTTPDPSPGTSRFFDFARRVAAAVQDFPVLKSSTLFVSTDAPDKTFGHWKAKLNAVVMSHNTTIKRQAQQALTQDSSFAFQADPMSGMKSVVFKPDDGLVQTLGVTVPKEQAQNFALQHEIGHLTVPKAYGDFFGGRPYPENSADSFATIRHLQENDQETLLPLVNSWARAYRFVATGNATHLSSTSTDALLALHKSESFTSMTPAQVVALAEANAQKNMPTVTDIESAQNDFENFKGTGKLYPLKSTTPETFKAFAETALASESRFTFQIGLSLLRPFLHPQGAEVDGVTVQLDDTTRRHLLGRFETKAQSLQIDSLLTDWNRNVDDLCRKESSVTTAAPVAKPVRLSLS